MVRLGAGAEPGATDREPPQLYLLCDREMEHVLLKAIGFAPPRGSRAATANPATSTAGVVLLYRVPQAAHEINELPTGRPVGK